MLHTIKEIKIAIFLVLAVFLSTGCHNYYMATTNSTRSIDKTVDSLKVQNRVFILRTGSKAFYMRNMALSQDRKALECILDSLPPEHRLAVVKGRHGKMQYNKEKAGDIDVLNEVHLYVSTDNIPSMGAYMLSLDKVSKIEVIQKDKNRTRGSYVLGAVGYTFGVIAIAAIIIAATKESCPFVSAYDGNQFALQGEIFGGAIYPQLVRHDFLPLKMAPDNDGNLQVKISNELQEKQYTDMAELIVIRHDKNARVGSDANGKLYSIKNPQAPTVATLDGKFDVRDLVSIADNRLCYFDDSTTTAGTNTLNLQFRNTTTSSQGKLVLKLKNSYWLDYLYGELARGFGKYYNTYMAKQYKRPAAELKKWSIDQDIPLQVSIKTKEGWKKITDLNTIGPLATRELVIPVDLSSVSSSTIEIQMSSGYLFWEVDYAAMDFGLDEKLDMQVLQPFSATDETGKDVLSVLAKEDNKYLEQPQPGTVTTLEYKFIPSGNANDVYSYILHTRGYYLHVHDFKGNADKKFLTQFKKPGTFPLFSLRRFREFNKQQMESFATK